MAIISDQRILDAITKARWTTSACIAPKQRLST
jgi:hypothetical protein